ncbi:low molecular weight protein-tyrosine-phosphatase [Listeria sp. PSOL-1]|uniref:low molecular weight protein-tyrosine-phosphatase n=1 Tax=Listeria sp. PSOL-1 TaxID=1844999 RepID=UPI0013D350C0|nr:low molecular weight protein-tyrosine-phosphatase [Listeria sp. PSOL-1]
MIKVIFVCLGNICRSPMAEGIFSKMVEEARLSDQISIRSFATGSWNLGNSPHRGTKQVLKKLGIDYADMRAEKLMPEDIKTAQYIVGMDDSNVRNILKVSQDEDAHMKVKKLMDYVKNPEATSIPDPYYTGDFMETERLITAGCEALLKFIRVKEGI